MNEPLLTANSLVKRAQEISDSEERREYLYRVCGSNAELRQRVEALLHADDESAGCLDRSAATLDTSEIAPGRWFDPKARPSTPLEAVGSCIGPHKLLQQIGEGGMGIVFMAEQQEPVRRMVALKIIKAGMDSAQVIARFEAEQQALALMDHPNIAKVLEAGQTTSGRPYFVMELVKGIPITKYCDEQRLSPRQRLELFVPVCQAIQHAHQKGIIHRDIKPSNVLIAAYDGKPVPKIIDFGVAKAMGQKLTEHTLFTGFGGIIGTLAYMSPEQTEFNALDIDTRSDVYSLGVLLYELLTGTTPLSQQRIKNAAILDVLRLIREEEPQRPSTRLGESKGSLASVSAQRQMEPATFLKAVRGEVDWIVMKAMEKDRTRRYETANSLARDIERYLADEPLEAGPPSARYRLRKLLRKHRRGLAVAAALLLLLMAGTVISASLAIWAWGAEKKALLAEQTTKRSEEDTKAVLEYFRNTVLAAGRPEGQGGGQGKDVTLRKAVDAAESEIAEIFADRPLVEASIRDTLGTTYWYLSEAALAIKQLERASVLRESILGPEHPDTLASRNHLALVYLSAGRTEDAIRLHEQILSKREAKLGPYHLETLTTRNNLAEAYRVAGRTEDAIRLLEPTLRQMETMLGTDHPDTLKTRNNLAIAYWSAGRNDDAIRLEEQTLKQREAKLGINHPDTLKSRNNLASAYWSAKRYEEALRLLEQTFGQCEAKLGENHIDTLKSLNNMAVAYFSVGKLDRSIPLFEDILRRQKAALGLDHPDTLLSRASLGVNYRDVGRIDDAIAVLEDAWQRSQKLRCGLPASVAGLPVTLAEIYDRSGQFAKAEPIYRAFLKQSGKSSGIVNAKSADAMALFGLNLLHLHKYSQAEPLLKDSLKVWESKQPDSWMTFNIRSLLGEALLGQKKYADAEPLLISGYQGMKQREKSIPAQEKIRITEAVERLVQLYEATDKKDEADKWRKLLPARQAAEQK